MSTNGDDEAPAQTQQQPQLSPRAHSVISRMSSFVSQLSGDPDEYDGEGVGVGGGGGGEGEEDGGGDEEQVDGGKVKNNGRLSPLGFLSMGGGSPGSLSGKWSPVGKGLLSADLKALGGASQEEIDPISWSRVKHFSVEMDSSQNLTGEADQERGVVVVRLIPSTRGNVIAGLDEGVRHMSLGEVATIKVCVYI